MTALLEVRNLEVTYGESAAVRGVSFEVRQGDLVTIIGANGAGKSTTLRAIMGLQRPRAGRILFGGADITTEPAHRRARRGISLVPEGRRILPDLTVEENLRLGAYALKSAGDVAAALERAYTLFPRLRERAGQRGKTMSGGEQQMLAIARGLMANPKVLLLDEPSLGLSPLLVKNIFDIITGINKEGVTILLVEQNVYQSLRIAHGAYVMETGRVVLTGRGDELLNNEHIKKAFLGM